MHAYQCKYVKLVDLIGDLAYYLSISYVTYCEGMAKTGDIQN
jgi:hypothetical protein